MKSKLKIIVPIVLLLVLGGVYKFVIAKPAEAKLKVDGAVYILPKEFMLNLANNHFAKVSVALVLPEGEAPAKAEGEPPPEGFGLLPQEAVVRAVVTDTLTDAKMRDLTGRKGRHMLEQRVLKSLKEKTDVKVNDVLFTDVAVQ